MKQAGIAIPNERTIDNVASFLGYTGLSLPSGGDTMRRFCEL